MREARNTYLSVPYLIMPDDPARQEDAGASFGGASYPAANRAIYMPFSLPVTKPLKSMAVWATTVAGTFDLGIYDEGCSARLVSQGSASVVSGLNTFTLATPFLLEAGVLYHAAMSHSSTAQFVRFGITVNALRLGGAAQEASAHPLPSTATPAQVASAYMPGIILDFIQ